MRYSEKEEKEILKNYKLTQEEHDQLYDIIKRTLTANAYPVENPVAIIVGGQTGAGKTGILSYSQKMFQDDNVVIINSDEIKPFHPKGEEIAKKYPDLYTKITDQESNTWTSRAFEEIRREGYNLIFEGTMKNNRIADESISELEKLNYTVIVRGISVCDLESRLSIFERYVAQVRSKGWGRLVVAEHHNQTYNGMPETIKYIEENGYYDIIEIFKRGETPDNPSLIYSKHNSQTTQKIQSAIKQRKFVSNSSIKYGYESAKDSIIKGRNEDYDKVIPTYEARIRKIRTEYINNRNNSKMSNDDIENENRWLIELMDFYKKKVNEIKKKNETDLTL